MTVLDSEITVQRLFPVLHSAGCVARVSRCQCQGRGELLSPPARWFPSALPVCDRGAGVTAGVSPSRVSWWPREQGSDRTNFTVRE